MTDERKFGKSGATLELTQEIGQVSFLFSDKTGTLTRNEMKLVGAEVGELTIFDGITCRITAVLRRDVINFSLSH